MTASVCLAAVLACAQVGTSEGPVGEPADQALGTPREGQAGPRAAASKIVAVTVYQGQALVTREVQVGAGEGTVELVVGPLPPQTIDGSLYTEGNDGLRVLSTRFRTRAVKDDTRRAVQAKEEQLRSLSAEAERLHKDITVREQDLKYLSQLETFTAATLTSLTRQGRLESRAIIDLSQFIMERRQAKTSDEAGLHERLEANTESAGFARRQLEEISAGSSRIERDALIVVNKLRPEAATVRLGYLVGSATWRPQYRLRGAADNAPVRFEYLAAVAQQTGEDWPGVRVTLSTARPSLDAAPPELLPLRMSVADDAEPAPIDARDDRSLRIAAELEKPIDMRFPNETPLEDVVKYVKQATVNPAFPEGLPFYIDPIGLQEAEKTMTSPVTLDLKQVPLKTSLALLLRQLGLVYRIKEGVVMVVWQSSDDAAQGREGFDQEREPGAGFGGMGPAVDQAAAFGGSTLNQMAASDQAEELRVREAEGPGAAAAEERDTPSVTYGVAGTLDIPSRRDPQLLEVARLEMPADYYAKAVPVLTPRVYRLARLSNDSPLVLLPGEATVYVGGDFVGRMRLPLVAAGEPFVAGFGVDPQLQVTRRLLHKARTVQGGNQIFSYEFRIGLRNFRARPVQVQLWDRLPKPQGETVAVNLVKSSVELSNDSLYQRTAKMDNLLRWDLEVPRETTGDKTMYLNYEFRLEYARTLPQPHFLSGGLREGPIGGGAMGGMGGMGGGFLSVPGREP